ncbi:MAG: LysM peptidoglycan-binding domain-containing protein [Chloroflexota bacterium]
MAKQSAPPTPPPRLCPTCGTRVGDLATKCIVCGADLGGPASNTQPQRAVRRSLLPQRPSFMRPADQPVAAPSKTATPPSGVPTGQAAKPASTPQAPAQGRRGITLPLPAALAIILIFLAMGVVLVLGAMGAIPLFTPPTPTITLTPTASPTLTPLPTATETTAPSPTPLPPVEYTVASGDTCISIAFNANISLQALLEANGLSQACPLVVGQKLTVLQPTYTPTAPPTNTLEAVALTETARPRTTYTVVANDTLFSIAAFYNVDPAALAAENGIPPPDYPITGGLVLTIPLDRPPPTVGPSPTATPLPPYPAPILLSPPEGAAISPVEQTVTLQWNAVDILQEGEVYLVSIEDVTCNCARRKLDTTTATRYIVNVDMKPEEAAPHVFKWSVVTARQTGTNDKGDPVYEPAGATSEVRTFTWTGIGVPATATPSP